MKNHSDKQKQISVITSSRADFGLLESVCQKIELNTELELSMIATGTHLSAAHGYTINEVKSLNSNKLELVDLKIAGDTELEISQYTARAISHFAEIFSLKRPDLILVLGDRYEIFGSAIAARFFNIPLIHIHGGELTEGAYDDFIRHSLTKMACLHFTSTQIYADRVIQLGENPTSVFNVGGLGAEIISQKTSSLLSKHQLEIELGIILENKSLFVTYHPETLSSDNSVKDFSVLLDALDELEGTTILFSLPNADTGFTEITNLINSFVVSDPKKRKAFHSLGQLKYFSVMQCVDAVVGNSSSGILEAPSFNIGTINIGDRQKGRLKSDSVIDIQPNKKEILNAFEILYSDKFQNCLKISRNPYYKKNTSNTIVDIISTYDFSKRQKHFFDIEFR
jgi:GDP/UDP-N,N'-diacetylbacillosamine 2-epimerase (hydrolysing)